MRRQASDPEGQTAPSKAFEQAVKRGSVIIPDMEVEKQLYIQQQELEGLREQNATLKQENDRYIKLLYEKEQAA
jgi:hypothetical protein